MVSAAGVGGGGLNRLGIAAPISGQIIARPVTLGQTVAADAELYRIANLSQVSIALNLKPEDAGRVRPGNTVLVKAAGRQATARVTFVSPALDPQTRLVPALATLDNRGGEWRVGEPVTAAVQLTGSGGSGRSACRRRRSRVSRASRSCSCARPPASRRPRSSSAMRRATR
jgi:cobalt-zinc-cadmium efflux system membrane fusion protein